MKKYKITMLSDLYKKNDEFSKSVIAYFEKYFDLNLEKRDLNDLLKQDEI